MCDGRYPADALGNLRPFGGGPDITAHQVSVSLGALHRDAGKDPILRSVIRCTPPREQIVRHVEVEWHRLSGRLGLAASDDLVDDRAADMQFEILEIDIPPFQTEQLPDAQTGSRV
jgi:hypothetical protein